MVGAISQLFDTDGFPARWYCGSGWTAELGWTHIVSDLAIFGAYTAIPLVIAFFVLKRRDVPFHWISWLFVTFIFACGTTHLIEAIIFWQPVYRLAGTVKVITALASWGTVVALMKVTPIALRLPGQAKLSQDLTHEMEERKEAELKLREGEERLRFALAAGRMGAWEWKVASNRVIWSAELEQIHGLVPGTFGGTFEAFLSDMHPEDRERVTRQIRRTVEEGVDHHVEYRIVLPDGRVRWVEGRGRLFRDAQGNPERMNGVCMDATHRKMDEEERERLLESERHARSEAERASRVKDEFLSLVSHELRTPLNAIMGYSQLLSRALMKPEEVRDAAAVIERNSRAQAQIIDDLLDMSRIVAGKMRLDVQRVEVPEVVQAAIETVRPAAQAKEIALQAVLDPRAGIILGDSSRLQQVFWNLLSNAIKFTPKQGKVQVSLERVNSHVEIRVSDSGAGIKREFLPFVFERFRQAEATSSRRHGGIGLGLSIVQHLVELHGGSVKVDSLGEGHGSTFTVSLPVQMHQLTEDGDGRVHPAAERWPAPRHEAPSLAGLKVLVVDDEQDARTVVRRLLAEHEVEVLEASSAEEALVVMNEQPPDVIVSDIGMPIVDGYQFIRAVRGREDEVRRTPAAALTAFARSEDRTRALLAGFQAHITKPVNANELVAVVAALAGRTTVQEGR